MNRIDRLLAEMTLAEKLGQLTMTASGYAVTGPVIVGDSTASIVDGTLGNLLNIVGPGPTREVQRLAVERSRLGIPLLIGLDVIHGHRMLFPLPIAETALFDPAAWEATAREAAAEAAADGIALTFAPMLDVARDPRWGRTAEGPGEDPHVATRLAAAKVRGFQGARLDDAQSLAACAKHYVAYGAVTAGRDYAPVDVSERTLREVHLPPFEAAVAAGVATLMPAFTDLAGIPMTAHVGLLRGHLRERLGWDGVVISDYNAIGELVRHGVAADLAEAAALALDAGVDIDMMAQAYRKGLPVALERGRVGIGQIDAAVRRVLRLKEALGLFDDPYRRGSTPEAPARLEARRALAREVAARAIVLLKNAREALPLTAGVRRLAVVGPLADAPEQMCGCWWAAGEAGPHVGVLAGLREALPAAAIAHAPGVAIDGDATDGIAAALAACDGAEAVVLCLGEAARMSGEAACRADPVLPGRQRVLAEAVLDRAGARGVPVVAVLFSGRPLVVPWLAERADALVAAWFLGTEAGHALADVLSGRVAPSGKTPMSWPRSTGQIPLWFGQRPSGRPFDAADPYTSRYLDVANDPLFAFGHGLGYTRFELANLRVAPAEAGAGERFEVQVDVRNVGDRAGVETVFVFSRDLVASVARPLLELKRFAQARPAPGETETLTFDLSVDELGFLGRDLEPVCEPGEIELLVGTSAVPSALLSIVVRIR